MSYRRIDISIRVIVITMAAVIALGGVSLPSRVFAAASYPYHSKQFTRYVDESFRQAGRGSASQFYDLMSRAYDKAPTRLAPDAKLGLEPALDYQNKQLRAIRNAGRKTTVEIDLAARTHKLVKSTIPRFSLDRGFEFSNVVAYGERQCFLQSVLIAGMLQRMGMSAGVAMVNRNIQGQPTNNGHAVTLLKLPNGRDIIVDASEPEPFAKHRGLFVEQAGYRYVEPVFEKNSAKISAYLTTAGRTKLATSKVSGLDNGFLRSQFWYYRGERVKGGPIYAAKTKAGLARSQKAFETSVKLCPSNPLAVYMLGRTYADEGRTADATRMLQRSVSLYSRFGWIPAGPLETMASSKLSPGSSAHRPASGR